MRRLLLSTLVLSLTFGCANRARTSVALYEAGDYAGASRAADEGLASHPDDDALWAMKIRAALAQGDGPAVAKAYASYVGKRGEDDAELLRELSIATLGQALGSPSVKLKIAAIQAVEDAEIFSLAEQVGERMEDDDDRVAAAAAIAVLRGFTQAPGLAAQMLRSEDPEARRIAVDGIGRKIGALASADLQRAAKDVDRACAASRSATSASSRTRTRFRSSPAACAIPTRACVPPPRRRSPASAARTSRRSASRP